MKGRTVGGTGSATHSRYQSPLMIRGKFKKCTDFPDEPRRAYSTTFSGVPSVSGTAGSRDRRRHAEAETARGAGGAGRGGRGRGGRRAVAVAGADHAGELRPHPRGNEPRGGRRDPWVTRRLHYRAAE